MTVVKERVAARLEPLLEGRPTDGRVDESWYWATPFLLDSIEDPDATYAWLGRANLSAAWAGPDERGEDFARHLDALRWLTPEALGRPPADLIEIVAKLALAGPGVVALRALSRVVGGQASLSDEEVRDSAARIAWGLRSLFNLPEVTALVRRSKAYWKAVLDYCVAGCLQSVLDEYAHVLVEWLGVVDRRAGGDRRASRGDDAQLDRASHGDVRDPGLRPDAGDELFRKRAFRARFALRFGDNRIDEERDSSPADSGARSFQLAVLAVRARHDVGRSGRVGLPPVLPLGRCTGTCPPIRSIWNSARAGSTATRGTQFARTSPPLSASGARCQGWRPVGGSLQGGD